MSKKTLSLADVYKLIEPGPVVMVSTLLKGKPNVMTMAWHMMVEFTPPLIACVMSNQNASFAALKKTKQCVINIPTADLAKKVVGVGSVTGTKVDKFKKFGLTPMPALQVAAPVIAECYANLECKVVNTRLARSYNIFVLEVVKAWIDPAVKNPKTLHHRGHGSFVVDGAVLRVPFGRA